MPLDPVGRLCHDRPMAEPATRYAQTKKRLNPWVIALIALIHLGLFYLLVRALAPTAVSGVERSVVSAFTVTVSTPEEKPEPTEPERGGARCGHRARARAAHARRSAGAACLLDRDGKYRRRDRSGAGHRPVRNGLGR